MLSRPSDNGHTPFGDIFYSESPDMEFWGRHRHVMSPAPFEDSAWQCTKIGAGPIPIETSEGWLLIYHGVLASCNGFVYSFGSALLDIDQPWKVKFRSGPYLISPQKDYECMGVCLCLFPMQRRFMIRRPDGCHLLWVCGYSDRARIRIHSGDY